MIKAPAGLVAERIIRLEDGDEVRRGVSYSYITVHRSLTRCIALTATVVGCAWPALGSPASAAATHHPIKIDDCHVSNGRSFVSAYKPVAISFTNRNAMTAEVVGFTVVYAGRTERIIDKGSFFRDVQIDHAFDGFYNAPYLGPAPTSCRVDYVDFSDGSVWNLDAATPLP